MREALMLLGRGLFRLGLASWIIRIQRDRVRGVLYHAVEDVDTLYNRGLNLSVSLTTFDRQLAYFSRYYQFDISNTSEAPRAPEARPWLAISFDDGYSSVYQNAWPILQKYNAAAVVFLATTAVKQNLLWFNALNWALHKHAETARKILAKHLPDPLPDLPRDCVIEVQEHSSPATIERVMRELYDARLLEESHSHYLTPSQIDEMRAGGIAFGFHTVNHYNLINCNTKELAQQLDCTALRSLLSDRSFAYPCGYYNTEVLNTVVKLGFDPVMGVGFDNARHCQRHLDRVEIYHADAASIFAQLEVAEPLLALFRRWMRRETGRRSSLS